MMDQEESFLALKKKNCAKNLSYNTPIFPNPFILTTDASGVAIGDPITRRNK